MRAVKTVLILIVIVLTASLLASGMAYSDDHFRGGRHYYRGGGYYGGLHYYGPPVWRPWRHYPYYYPRFYLNYYPNYYPYYYSYPPTVLAPSAPPVYIERGQEESESESAPSGVWYFCPDSKAYYPYVKECPGGWETLPAEPRR